MYAPLAIPVRLFLIVLMLHVVCPGGSIIDSIEDADVDRALHRCFGRDPHLATSCETLVDRYSITYMFDLAGKVCPSVIQFMNTEGYHDDNSTSVLDALLGATRVIRTCRPLLLVDNSFAFASRMILDFLTSMGYGSTTYWYVPMAPEDKANDDRRATLVAIPPHRPDEALPDTHAAMLDRILSDVAKTGVLFLFQPGHYNLPEYVAWYQAAMMHSSILAAWTTRCYDGTRTPCVLTRSVDMRIDFGIKHMSYVLTEGLDMQLDTEAFMKHEWINVSVAWTDVVGPYSR
jgi:hypothetical protein